MDGVAIPKPSTLISSSLEPRGFTSIPNASLDFRLPTSDGGEWMMTKAEMLQNQFKSMATIASCYASTFKIQNAFLVGKVEINNELTNLGKRKMLVLTTIHFSNIL